MSGDDFRHRHKIDSDTLLADARRAFAQRQRELAGGFLDPGAARRVVRRMRLRAALEGLQASISALLDRIDKAENAANKRRFALVVGGIDLADDNFERGAGGEGVDAVERQDVREEELLQGLHLTAQLFNALFEGFEHGLFSAGNAPERNRAAQTTHRLCGDAK